MTFIVGFIYKETVQIIADSAETHSLSNNVVIEKPYSSSTFLEATHINFEEEESRTEIFEAAQKIYIIKNNILIAFAGDVVEGVDAVRQLKYILINRDNLIINVIIEFFTKIKSDRVQYIIGFYENEKPHLFKYSSPNEIIYTKDPKSFVYAGTLGKPFKGNDGTEVGLDSFAANSLMNAMANDFDPEETLIMTIAYLQMHNIHIMNITEGVGGFFNGVLLSNKGIKWAPDTCYMLYSMNNFEKGIKHNVFKYNRNDAVF